MNRVGLIVIAVALSGCGHASETEDAKDALKAIGFRYHSFSHANGRPPADLEEFVAFSDPAGDLLMNADLQATGDTALAGGEYVVNWSVDITGTSEDRNRILAYHKEVPEHGGYVCYGLGEVKKLTAEEFASEPQAMPSSKQWVAPDELSSGSDTATGEQESQLLNSSRPEDSEAVQREVRRLLQATYQADVDTVLSLTHPIVIQMLGGDQKARSTLAAAFTQLQTGGLSLESLGFP